MKDITHILGTSLILFIISSCNKDKLVAEYYISDELKAQNPFNGYETLRYKNNSG